ncbi:SRPBCC family protein [Streptomyces sp. NPDC059443]|uniref:SRPBCC family protein n=1 Tax=unclassified Streptomyces TaxID=2593676 RepID=UPI0036BF8672
MQNFQQRTIDAPAAEVSALLDRLGSPQDRIWPAQAWSPLRLDAGLAVGSSGGHGMIRYSVAAYEPGRRVRFTFAPGLGMTGYHEFLITPEGPDRCRVSHTAAGRLEGKMRLLWPLAIRWMHEALLQDFFDNIQRAATNHLPHPARWSVRVRLLRLVFARKPRRPRTPVEPSAA